jgi:hypothetical protein
LIGVREEVEFRLSAFSLDIEPISSKRVYAPLSKREKASLNYEERSKGEAGRNESVVTRGEGGRGRGIGAYFGDLRFRLQRGGRQGASQ